MFIEDAEKMVEDVQDLWKDMADVGGLVESSVPRTTSVQYGSLEVEALPRMCLVTEFSCAQNARG